MNSQLDLNIDKYTKEELIKLLGLQQPINEEKVTQAIGALLDGYTQKYQVNQNILQFFFDMKQKLLKKELTDYEIQRKKQEEEEKETPEGIREYIDMIRRALTLDPNTLELSDFQKKALYTTVTAKNAEDKLKVYNKILNDYDPIEQPSEVPNYDPYATKNS